MNKMSMLFGAISAVSAAFACAIGGGCLYYYVEGKRRKLEIERSAESAAIGQLMYDVHELKLKQIEYENLLQEKKS